MSSTRERLVESVCSLLERGVALVLEYNEGHPDFPLPPVRRSESIGSSLSSRTVDTNGLVSLLAASFFRG